MTRVFSSILVADETTKSDGMAPCQAMLRPAPAFRLQTSCRDQLAVLANRTSQRFRDLFGGFARRCRSAILATLGEGSPIRAKDIEAIRHMHKTVVSRAVATLYGA